MNTDLKETLTISILVFISVASFAVATTLIVLQLTGYYDTAEDEDNKIVVEVPIETETPLWTTCFVRPGKTVTWAGDFDCPAPVFDHFSE